VTSAARIAGLPSYFIVFVASMVAIGPFAIDTYLPAMPAMATNLGVEIVSVNATLSTYLFGFAFGQMFGGPISDQIGRRRIGLLGLVVFSAASVLIALAESIEVILWLRALQAVGGGFATVICMAMVRDAYEPMEAAKRFPVVMLVMLGAPLAAPAIGAALLSFGWPSIFIFLALYGLAVLVAFLPVPETASMRTGKLELGRILPQYAEVYFGIAEEWFVVYFGVNILMMMVFTLITTRLIHRVAPDRLWRAARGLQFLAVVMLALGSWLFDLNIWTLTGLLSVVIGANGMINPSASGLYLAYFDRLSGSAVSLMNVAVFLFGSVLGVVTGVFFDGTLKPIVFTMAVAITVGNLNALGIPPPKNLAPDASGESASAG
jgi:DHA1 family bicyclomycin/chloramphenicol resistance-like MFS transporter